MIEVEFLYTKEEWVDGRRKFLLQSKMIKKMDIFILAAMVLINIFFIRANGFHMLNGILCVFMLIFGGLIFMLYVVQPVLLYQSAEKYHHPYKLQFYEDGLRFETQGISSDLKWDIYSSYLENANYFYLMQGKSIYMLLPKRAFASEEDLGQFQKLIQAHFKK